MRFCTLLLVVALALTFSAALGFWEPHSLTSQVKTQGKNEEQKIRRINILGYEDEDYDEDDVYFDHDCQPTGTPLG
ncbi:hypothetical protein TELCIR_09562 [Teladorsagia circumcincta]|uniref:Uncharacterized protein n=1 Tax=Teladorsagia circumcincta TaxID=45464 RepID=A0A2G9UEI0_TELCI|nr:hypothetical protein TELCIR_09562 [Teladorsagia circumcincta]